MFEHNIALSEPKCRERKRERQVWSLMLKNTKRQTNSQTVAYRISCAEKIKEKTTTKKNENF